MKETMARGNQWADHYTRRAGAEKWLARSIYKLEEIDRKFGLIKPGYHLLDLGCYPGSWSQYGIRKVGPKGEVVGVDMKSPDRFSAPNFKFIKADVLLLDQEWLKGEIGERHAVLSDMAPQTSGIRVADESRSLLLAERALSLALSLLKRRGHFLCKVFEGDGLPPFRTLCSRHFEQIRTLRPSAVRKGSREVYLIGLGLV